VKRADAAIATTQQVRALPCMKKTTDKIAGKTKQVIAEVTGDGKLAEEGKQQAIKSEPAKLRSTHLTRYFFHLEGDLPAHDPWPRIFQRR
jgi:hypothetical protein